MKDDILDINGEFIQLEIFNNCDEDNQWIISKRESDYNRTISKSNDDDIETKDYTYLVPSFIIFINIITIFFYSYGLIDMDNNNIEWYFSAKSPVSPNIEMFFYRSMSSYPQCSNKKNEIWRLFSYQFVHSGPLHILGNVICSLAYGIVFEKTHPMGRISIVFIYEFSVALGALCHNYVFPYVGLIGSSAGVYGVIGACMANIIINGDLMQKEHQYFFRCVFALQFFMDVFSYLFMWNSKIGYSAHLGGFFCGLLLTISLGLTRRSIKKKICGILGLILFIIMTVFLCYQYSKWPPNMPWKTDFMNNKYNPIGCCGELYQLVNSTYLFENAYSDYYCKFDHIEEKNGILYI